MRDREEGRPTRLIILFAALVLALAAIAAGCGGDDDDEEAGGTNAATGADTGAAASGTIKIGIFANNEGGFAPFEGQTWGGAMLPLIERGATAKSGDPTKGVDGATIAGKNI